MELSEDTLYLLASLGDLDAMRALATIDIPSSGIEVSGGDFYPAGFWGENGRPGMY